MNNTVITILKAISDTLTAGVAIISFSLFIFSITFRLHDRVTVSFTLLLLNAFVIFGTDAFLAAIDDLYLLSIIIRVHWIGIITMPALYFYFSDAVLAMTGKPSKGKRQIAGILFFLVGIIFLFLLFSGLLIGELIVSTPPRPHLERTIFNDLFTGYFISVLALAWFNFIRAYLRTTTRTSRRRILYLIVSAFGPAVGAFPFLLYGSNFAANLQIIFWILSILASMVVYFSLITMTYSISFYGFPWTDRLIRSRLFRWVMRGPITASLTLGVTILINRISLPLNLPYSRELSIIGMTLTIVLFEYMVTIFAPIWERLFFGFSGRTELEKVKQLEDKMLTSNDFRQFLELILATICDRLQISRAQIIFRNGLSQQIKVTVGVRNGLTEKQQLEIWNHLENQKEPSFIESINSKTVIPLFSSADSGQNLMGAIVLFKKLDGLVENPSGALEKLVGRAELALEERENQEKLLLSLEMLTPRTNAIQNLLAVSRFNQQRIIEDPENFEINELSKMVKGAMGQIWGGPRILRNPMVKLKIVRERISENNESPINAIRETLKEGLNRLKPEGTRQYTNEWLLYNILDLKYFEGWRVKEIIQKLALSEADFYRKQRDAIDALSRQILEMETEHRDSSN